MRRATRNRETGEPINYELDEKGRAKPVFIEDGEGGSIPSYTSYGEFINRYKNIDVKDGIPQYTNAQTAKLKKLTPYKVFRSVIMGTYWNAVKDSNLINDIPNHLKMRFYGLLSKYTWLLIRNHVISERLNLEIPKKKEQREYIEKSNNFKRELHEEITNILRIAPRQMYEHFNDAFEVAKNHLQGIAADEERLAKKKPKEVNKKISEKNAKAIWKNILNEYGVSEEEQPFAETFTTWKRADQGMEFDEWLNTWMNEAVGRQAIEDEDDEGNWLD